MEIVGTSLTAIMILFSYKYYLVHCGKSSAIQHQATNFVNSTFDSTLLGSKASDHLRIRSGVMNPQKDLILTVNTRNINVSNITAEDLEYLNNITELAYFGEGNKTVKNIHVRNSKYTSTFDLNLNLLNLAKKIGIEDKIIKPYKLNLYNEGCFFDVHRDTSRHGLVGTLILILPTTYTGGNIIFGRFNLEETMPKDKLRFIYFDIGLEHSISKVTSGNRITLVYNVFNPSSKALVSTDVHFNDVHQVVYGDLLKEAIEFCTGKKNVLLGHEKYRNDVFHKLVKDLNSHFKIIEVAVEKDRVANLSNIREVYKVREPTYDYPEDGYLGKESIILYATKKFQVEHVLFPLASNLNQPSSWTLSYQFSKYRGNDEEFVDEDTKLEFYTGFLINPSNLEDMDDDEESDTLPF